MYTPFFVSSYQKMKKIVAGILLWVNVTVTAQPVYEVFAVNGKYGIVNTTDFSTFVVPSYPLFDDFYQDCLALGNGTACYFFDKTSGDKTIFINLYQSSVKINGKNYFHFVNNQYSYLIPDVVKEKIKLPKKYDYFKTEDKHLVSKAVNGFDVYKTTQFSKPVISDILATACYLGIFQQINTDHFKTLWIFYGKSSVFVYSDTFKRLKKYPVKVTTLDEALTVIKEHFIPVATKELTNTNAVIPLYWRKSYENGITTVTSWKNAKNVFTVKGYFEAYKWFDDENWVQLQSLENKENYIFKLDFANKRVLLPKTYLNQLHITFL